MNCQQIEEAFQMLSVNSRGAMRGKGKVIDKIYRMHLKKVDDDLMEIRVFVARLSTGNPSTELLKLIDDFIYKKQQG